MTPEMKRYNPKDIEPKWQKWWAENNTYVADLSSDKKKYMASGMFNYPSGNGIHVGHAYTFTIPDVLARYKRQQGYESLNPVGWDSFGLPAENYAIKVGVSPQQSMATIIPNYHKQYTAMGWGVDWTKEITSSEPMYYKWTQWIFSQMYKNGLAYQDARMQWWCNQCQTVLANEQVIDDKCWRHDKADDPTIEKKEIKQWFFKITDYADELLEAVDGLNWTESVKSAQKNWIGKSKGAEIIFRVTSHQSPVTSTGDKGQETGDSITVFTTRPDTIFGATFLVLAPEHPLVSQLTEESEKPAVEAYVKEAAKKTEVERQANKDKTGVFTGSYAINPVNGENIPVWIADYVLVGYGTGAIMAVPAHDERDLEFAQKFGLQITEVVKTKGDDPVAEGIMTNSGVYDGMSSSDAREKIVADLAENGLAIEKTQFKIRDWSVSRQRYWGAPIPIINCEKCGPQLVPDEQLPVVLPELDDFQPSGDGRSALARAKDWLHVDCPHCGEAAERETDTLDTYICSSWYLYRYIDPQNQEAIFRSDLVNKWFPIDFYDGADHATAHLLYARFIGRFFYKLGLVDNPEPIGQMLYHGKVLGSDGSHFSKSAGNGVDPLEVISQGYGADALRTYLMFAAPAGLDIRWDPQGVPGTYRFLNRIWVLCQEYLAEVESQKSKVESGDALLRVVHPAIKKVTEDLEDQKYNTAIAAMMKATNDLYAIKAKDGVANTDDWRFALESLVQLIAPFAPHTAEELWHDLGHENTVHRDTWPDWNKDYLVSDLLTIAVQVSGKLRATIEVATDATETEVLAAAQAEPKVAGYLEGQHIKKSIYVPKKLVNFVV